MPTTVPAQRGHHHAAAATAMTPPAAGQCLPVWTLAWLAEHPLALAVVEPVWGALDELHDTGTHPHLIGALKFVLVHHAPTNRGHCRACRRLSWRGLWRRRRFPCVVWRQVRGELLGHLSLHGRARTGSVRGATR